MIFNKLKSLFIECDHADNFTNPFKRTVTDPKSRPGPSRKGELERLQV